MAQSFRSPKGGKHGKRTANGWPTAYRFLFETLEDRTAPATFTWTGNGGNGNLSNPGNWQLGTAPTGLPGADDQLVFPALANPQAVVNDLAPGGARPVFTSVVFGGSNYSVSGLPVALGQAGAPSGSAALTVNAGVTNIVFAPDTRFNSGDDQSIFVNSGGNLRVTGVLSNAASPASQITKRGVGELRLENDNTPFTGAINVVEGILSITHRRALGSPGSLGASPTAATSVQTNAQLAVRTVTGPIEEALVLNGSGVAGDGALLNVSGNNVWSGPVLLNTDTVIGSFGNPAVSTDSTQLRITGRISDAGGGRNLTKVGRGEVVFAPAPGTDGISGNTYRGLTTVNDGVLTIADPQALGQLSDPTQQGTVVNQSPPATSSGQLRIGDATGNSFTVLNERLVLNGNGQNGAGLSQGALVNAFGTNTWASSIQLGSPLPDGQNMAIGTAPGTTLIVHGVISSPNPGPAIQGNLFIFTKRGEGRLILTNNNTLNVPIIVAAGALTARESHALGQDGSSSTTVQNGATLELEVEAADPAAIPRFAPSTFQEPGTQGGVGLGTLNGRDLWADSGFVPGTGTANNQHQLTFTESLNLSGEGFNRTGALRSVTGQNAWVSTITLNNDFTPNGTGPTAANPLAAPLTGIGVEADPRNGVASSLTGFPTPSALYIQNDYQLTTLGVIQDPQGGAPSGFSFRYPATLVKRGFGNLVLPNANTYAGGTNVEQGWITARNDNSLGGDLLWDPRTLIANPAPPPAAVVYQGTLFLGPTQQPAVNVSGGAAVHLWPVTSSLTLDENFILAGPGIDDNPGPAVDPRQSLVPTRFNFIRSKGAVMSLAGGNNRLTGDVQLVGQVGIGVESVDVNNPASELFVTGQWSDFVFPGATPPPGGVRKFGQQRLTIDASGSYTGAVNIDEGTLRLRNSTGLGLNTNGTLDPLNPQQFTTLTDTVVAPGARLQLDADQTNERNAAAAAAPTGLQVTGERLTLSAPGSQYTVAGPLGVPTLGMYTLTVTVPAGLPGAGSYTTAAIPITASAALVRAELNAAPGLPAGLMFEVTQAGPVYSVVYTGSIGGTPVSQLLDASAAGISLAAAVSPGSGATVSVSNADFALDNLRDMQLNTDNAWRGPIVLSSGTAPNPVYPYTRIGTAAQTRLQVLGAITDGGSPLELVKAGNGALTLGGREIEQSTYTGPTTVLSGVVTAGKGTAFGSPAAGTTLMNGAQIQLQGSLTVAGENLVVQGNGPGAGTVPDAVVPQWLDVGPAGTNNGVTPSAAPISGRVTDTAVDPSDPNTIYIATAGGGAWRTRDGGKTWSPLFDSLSGLPQQAALWGGAIAVAPRDPNTLYYGTGEPNDQFDSFYGTGVYKSTDAGRTWTLLVDPGTGNNPFNGLAISKIAVDPRTAANAAANTEDNVFVAASSAVYLNRAAGGGTPGIYRKLDGAGAPVAWFNMTAAVPGQRLPMATNTSLPSALDGPNTPGPIDDFSIDFPQTNAAWTDLKFVMIDVMAGNTNARSAGSPLNGSGIGGNRDPRLPVLYAALGTATDAGRTFFGAAPTPRGNNIIGGELYSSAVYRNDNPLNLPQGTFTARNLTTQVPDGWFIGDSGRNDTNTGGATPVQVVSNGNSGAFPTRDTNVPANPPVNRPAAARNGNIKIGVFTPAPAGPITQPTGYPTFASTAVYAVTTYPADRSQGTAAGVTGGGRALWQTFRDIQYFGGALTGKNWRLIAAPAGGDFTNVQGYYNLTIAAPARDTIIIGGDARLIRGTGVVDGAGTPQTPTYTDINTALANGPHNQFHAVVPVYDYRIAGQPLVRTLVGTDGGLWSLSAANAWTDLNGNLQTQLVNSVDVNPTDFGIAFAGTQDTGAIGYTGGTAWNQLDRPVPPAPINTSVDRDRGVTRLNPLNPNVVYQTVRRGTVGTLNGAVRRTTDGGATWADLPTLPILPRLLPGVQPLPNAGLDGASPPPGEVPRYFPIVVDQVNPQRVLIGGRVDPLLELGMPTLVNYPPPPGTPTLSRAGNGTRLQLSLNGGDTWTSIATVPFNAVTALALSTNQGPFVADGAFPLVTDILSNTYDANTIYITDGANVAVTKNGGLSWVTRNIPGVTASAAVLQPIVDLAVDPGNRDVVYAVVQGIPGSGQNRVFRTTNAGQTWTDITGGALAGTNDVPFYKIAVDPRVRVGQTFGDLYLGTDNGVFRALNGASTNWVRYGDGMPQVSVRDLVLNQQLGTLTAATYGRGVMQLFLPDIQADTGAIRAVAGSSVWGGNITLLGDTVINVSGSQAVQNGITPATLNITGVISSDPAVTDADFLDKVGQGNLILSGPNTYANTTRVLEGILTSGNRTALGLPAGGTTVTAGAALQLQADLDAEPVLINGGGIPFNGHWTGALRNVSGNNTFTGTLTLGTQVVSPVGQTTVPPGVSRGVVVGVNSATSLRIAPDQANLMAEPGQVIGAATVNLVKELPGTLILGGDNDPSFDGQIDVIQGALQAQSDEALGTPAPIATRGTRVFDGAQLQLSRNQDTGMPVTIAAEPLQLSGGGIRDGLGNATGALQNVAGNNAYNGPITLTTIPNFFPTTVPPTQVAIGVLNPADTLLVGGIIAGSSPAFGLDKVGLGRLALSAANTYAGPTRALAGALRAQNNNALGTTGNGTTVSRGAALEVDGNGLLIAEPLVLNGLGTPTDNAGALRNVSGTNTYSGNVTLNNDLLPNPSTVAVGADAGSTLNVTGVVADTTVANPNPLPANLGGIAPLTTQSTVPADLVFNPLPSAGLRKVGAGTIGLNAVNTYTGRTDVNAGVLSVGNSFGLGRTTNLDREVQRITVTGANGRFAITYNGFSNGFQTFAPTGTAIVPNANPAMWYQFDVGIAPTAAQIEADLNALIDIVTPYPLRPGQGAVQVRQTIVAGVFYYDIYFDRELGFVNVAPLTTGTTGGVTAIPVTLKDGPQGTVVNPGGTLQLDTPNPVISEALQLNGLGTDPGTGPVGALRSGPGVVAQWGNTAGPAVGAIQLAGNSSLGADTGSTLRIDQRIEQLTPGLGVIKYGPGMVEYTGAQPNTYTGTTQVADGTLVLNRTGPANTAVPGNLAVGDGTGSPGTAVVQLAQPDQIADTSAVSVNADGLFNVNGQTEAVGPLSVSDGTVTTGGTGPQGLLTANQLTMQGGLIDVATFGDRVTVTGDVSMRGGTIDTVLGAAFALGGNLTAQPDAANTVPAVITGDGQLDLGSTAHTVTVTNGTRRTGLEIDAEIAGTGGIIKSGSGRLVVFEINSYTGNTRLDAGDFEVAFPGIIFGNVQLNGGTLSGDGNAGPVSQLAQPGTVSPGIGGTGSPSPAVLGVGQTAFGPNTTAVFELNNPNGVPLPGQDYDQIQVAGDIALGNAVLTGVAGPDILVGDSFTIVQAAGVVSGTFRDAVSGVPADRVFLNGLRFNVDYTDPTRVVLTRALNGVSLDIAPIAPLAITQTSPLTSTSQFGQALNYTVSLIPETGSQPLPAGSEVTVTLRNAMGTALDIQTLTIGAGGTATYSVPANLLPFLDVGTYTIDLSYAGLANVFPAVNVIPAITQEVVPATTAVGVTLTPTASVFGQPVQATASVAAVAPANGVPTAGNVQFLVDGTPVGPQVPLSGGSAAIALPPLPVGTRTVTAVFTSADGNFLGSTGSQTIVVSPAQTTATVTVAPPTGQFGQQRTINVQVDPVAPGAGVPTGTVSFFLGAAGTGTFLGQDTQTATNLYSLTLPTLPGGTYQVSARYVSNDGNFVTVDGSVTVTVSPAPTTTSIDPTLPATDIFGTDYLLRATVAGLAGFALPQGTVTFRDGATVLGTAPLTNVAGVATAVLTLNPGQLAVGGRSITATYNPAPLPADQNYSASTSTPFAVQVSLVAPTVTQPTALVYTNAPAFTVTGLTSPSVGIFVRVFADTNSNGAYDPGVDQLAGSQQVAADASAYSISVPLVANSTNLFFVTAGDGSDPTNQSAATPTAPVVADTIAPVAGTIAASNPYLSVSNGSRPTDTTLSATLTDTSPISWTYTISGPATTPLPTFSGTGATAVATWNGRDTAGNLVPDGVYTITLTSTDAAGNDGVPVTTQVTVFNGTVGVAASSNSPTVFGGPASFTATLSVPFATLQSFLVGKTVEFFNGTASLGTATVAQNGSTFTATLTTSSLPAGTYTVTARLNPNADFASVTSAPITHTVTQTSTATALTGNSPTVYGQEAVFTATVTSAVPAALIGSRVEFRNGGTLLGSAPVVAGPNGVPTATFRTTSLPAGTYTNITATAVPGPNFTPSTSAPITQQVTPATLTVRANDTSTVYGDPLPTIGLTVTGLVNNDQPSVVTGAARAVLGTGNPVTPATGVGAYQIGVGTLSAGTNYAVVFVPGTLTITPAPLTITANGFRRTVDQPNPALTATFTGLRNNDPQSVVSGLTLTTTATATSPAGTYPITTSTTPSAANYTITFVPGAATLTDAPDFFAVGSGTGFDPVVNLYNPDGTRRSTNRAFDAPLQGGVRVATGDFNNDGFDDMVVGTGPGAVTQVRVLDGRNGQPLFQYQPFESAFQGGVYVAAGDVNGDGIPDLVVTPDEGGGPRASVLDGAAVAAGRTTLLADFFGIEDPNFRGGARPAVGDINGDGFGELIVAAGFGGGPRITVWNGAGLAAGGRTVLANFFAFEPTLRNGTFVAAGDLNGDGRAEMIVGGGPGGGPRVIALDGTALMAGRQQLVANFFAGDTANRGGIRVAYTNPAVGATVGPRVVVGAGETGGSLVTVYPAESILLGGTLVPSVQFVAYNDLVGGVFVG